MQTEQQSDRVSFNCEGDNLINVNGKPKRGRVKRGEEERIRSNRNRGSYMIE